MENLVEKCTDVRGDEIKIGDSVEIWPDDEIEVIREIQVLNEVWVYFEGKSQGRSPMFIKRL